MKTITVNAKTFTNPVKFFAGVLKTLGAPDWHGLSINAFVDTMIWHPEVHSIRPPYLLRVEKIELMPNEVRTAATTLRDAIKRARADHIALTGRDVPVAIELDDESVSERG